MRQHCPPVILQSAVDPSPQRLMSVLLWSPPFDEAALQKILALNPSLLPLEDIELSFSPAVLLGREMGTAAGSIDLAFVSPSGQLAFVETKLWKNPGARREVVVQILDYAKEVSRWSYDDLNTAVRKSRKADGLAESGMSVPECLHAAGVKISEPELADAISRNLKSGRFLLLLVGEGIREGVEDLVGLLQSSPTLRFTIAMIELGLYRTRPDSDWPLLIQPRVLCRTEEIVRAVIDIRVPDGLLVSAEGEQEQEQEQNGTEKARKRPALTDALFRETLASKKKCKASVDDIMNFVDELRAHGLIVKPGTMSFSMRLPDPADRAIQYTVIVIDLNGDYYLGWLGIHFEIQSGYDRAIADRYLSAVAKLTGIKVKVGSHRGPDDRHGTELQSLDYLLARRAEYLQIVDTFIAEVKAAALGSHG